ncbi:MAG: ABC transporter transmembrane domain-containing protein, partial [Pseudomonadota bacterium]
MLKPNRLEQTKFAAQQQNAASDPYLAALEFLAFFHGKPFSEAEIRKRLPLVGGKLDAESFCRAAEKSGLVAKVVDRPATDVSALVCPFVVPLKNGDVAIATEKGSKGMTRLIIPGAPNVLEVAKGTLSQQAEDVVIYVADAAAGKELESGQKLRQGHWLWSVVSKYWATWIYVIAAALFINLLGLAVPLFVMNVYDRVIPNNSISTLWALAIGVVIALVFDFILRMLRAIVVDHSGRRIDMRVSSDLFDQAMDATMAARPASAGEIASHIREFEAVRDFFTSASISSLIDLFFIGIFLGVLWLLVGPLALVALFAVPVVLIVTLLIQIPLGRAVAKSQETISNRQSVLVETLVGIETIKAMSAEGVMQRKWEEAISGSVRAGSSIRFWSSLAMFFTMFTQQCVTVLILVWGAYLVADGEISIGALVASNILAGRVLAPLSSIAMTLARTQQSMTALRQLNKLMALDRDHGQYQDNTGTVKSAAFEFNKVTFSYPREETPAIDGLSISIDAGEQVGIIGRVGSGKSTFGKLLSGL